MSKFAVHYKTGEALPEELIGKIVKSRNYNVAYATIRQVSFGLIDMALHSVTKPLCGNLMKVERDSVSKVNLLPEVKGTGQTVHFGHIMDGGYAAGYYSYKWAEVLLRKRAYFRKKWRNVSVRASYQRAAQSHRCSFTNVFAAKSLRLMQ